MASPVILVEASPRRAADGVSETVRLAGGGNQFPYFYGGVHWRAGVAKLPTFVTELTFDGGEFGAGGVPQAAEIQWGAATSADLADLANYMWVDAPITLRIGAENAAGDLPGVVLTGKVLSALPDGSMLKISLSDPAADLKKPLLKASANAFGGTGGLDGPADWQGKIRKRLWGRLWNVQGECIDAANSIYCWSDPAWPLLSFDALRDKGAAAAQIDQLAWQGSAAATFAALQAAAAPQGGGIACPSIACVKWWTTPAGDLTADLRGEVAGGYVETTAEIVARIVGAGPATPFAAGTVAAAAALRPAPVGWIALDETTTVAAMIEDLLGSSSLLWLLNAAGEIELHPWAWGAPVAAARSLSVKRSSAFAPVGTRKLGFRRNELKMARGDLAGIVLVDNVEFPDGQALADAVANAGTTATWDGVTGAGKPQDNATVGAPSGTPVGSTTADQVATAVTMKVPALEAAQAALDADVQAAQTQIATVQGQAVNAATAAAAAHDEAAAALTQISTEVARAQGAEGVLTTNVANLQTGYSDLSSTVIANYAALSSTDASLAASITSLTANYNGLSSSISSEALSRTNADSALGSRIDTVTASVANNTAAINSEATVRASDVATLTSSINTMSSQFVLAGNQLSNTDFPGGNAAGWNWGSTTGAMIYSTGINSPSDDWHPAGENVFAISQGAPVGDQSQYFYLNQSAAAIPEQWYQFYAFVAAHRCTVDLIYFFIDDAGHWISAGGPQHQTVLIGGKDTSNWSQIGIPAVQAPAGARRLYIEIRKRDTLAGEADSWMWVWRPYVGPARTGQTAWNPYSAGSGKSVIESAQSTINANYTTLSNATASLANSVGTLQANYGNLSAGVSNNALAIATLQTQAATFEQRLSAGSSNLLKNGSGELGKSNWTDRAGSWFVEGPDSWGTWFRCNPGGGSGGGYFFLDSDPISVWGGNNYTVAMDADVEQSSGSDRQAWIEVLWFATLADANALTNEMSPRAVGQRLTSPWFGNSAGNRQALKVTAQAPAGATYMRVRPVAYGSYVTVAGFREIKAEWGTTATAYTQEASILVQQQVIATVKDGVTTALARAALTLDVNGYTTGYEFANNGVTGSMKFRTDLFEISSPSGGERTEYTGGNWRVYYANGNMAVRLGVWTE